MKLGLNLSQGLSLRVSSHLHKRNDGVFELFLCLVSLAKTEMTWNLPLDSFSVTNVDDDNKLVSHDKTWCFSKYDWLHTRALKSFVESHGEGIYIYETKVTSTTCINQDGRAVCQHFLRRFFRGEPLGRSTAATFELWRRWHRPSQRAQSLFNLSRRKHNTYNKWS